MKNNKAIAIFLVLLSCLLIVFINSESKIGYSQSKNTNFSLSLNTPKQTYILGEKIQLDIKVEKQLQEVIVPQSSKARCGYLKIQVANETRNYKDYFGPKWQTENCEVVLPLNDNEAFKVKESLLWNVKPEVSHLNKDAAKRKSKGRIMTDYVFPEIGTYYIKTVLSFPDDIQPKIESEPIKIIIEKPVGDDLEVWNEIKDDGGIAYFIETGNFLTSYSKTEERDKLQQKIERIINTYPNSFYTESLRNSLRKFQAIEAKRQEFLQKIRQQQKPQ